MILIYLTLWNDQDRNSMEKTHILLVPRLKIPARREPYNPVTLNCLVFGGGVLCSFGWQVFFKKKPR